MLRCIVEKLNNAPGGRVRLLKVFGNNGAPAWVGDRLTLIWLSSDGSVVLFAESSALAKARKGTRS